MSTRAGPVGGRGRPDGHRPRRPRATGLAAVLFDLDGTLLDSERLWDRALQELAARLGGTLSGPARQAMIGRNSTESMAVLYQDLGTPARDPVADSQFLTERMIELFATDLRWRPGAAELVTRVRAAGLATALVTSTRRRQVEVALDGLLGRDTFDAVVCGDEVTRPKPHPESYLTAAARIGRPIRRCVAIEDSPTGVASALAAGATVVGVPGEVPLPAGTGAHLVAGLAELDVPYLARLVGPAGRRYRAGAGWPER
jgi:HAD superfamily hydrolase (TIGR01509 family)